MRKGERGYEAGREWKRKKGWEGKGGSQGVRERGSQGGKEGKKEERKKESKEGGREERREGPEGRREGGREGTRCESSVAFLLYLHLY